MDKESREPTDSDQPRYQLRNRTTTTVSASSSKVTTMSHANLPAIDGRMADGRSEEEETDASQGRSPPREMPQPWAPARGGQAGQPPTLEKISVGHAHPGNISRGLKTFRQ